MWAVAIEEGNTGYCRTVRGIRVLDSAVSKNGSIVFLREFLVIILHQALTEEAIECHGIPATGNSRLTGGHRFECRQVVDKVCLQARKMALT
jgi:hypothetical protein